MTAVSAGGYDLLMALPIIADTFRCTLNYATFAAASPVNVLHVRAPGLSVTEVGDAIFANEQVNMLSPVPEGFEPTSWSILPLDGSSPTHDVPRGPGAVAMCEAGSAEPIMEAAYIMSIKTGTRGPQGRGRLFLGPIGEPTQNGGRAVGDGIDHLNTAWGDFVTSLFTDGVLFGMASYTHAQFHGVESILAKPYIGTQRRRLLSTR